MNTTITQAQIDRYRADGFVVVPDFLSRAELDDWRDALDEALGRRGRAKLPGGRWKGEESVYPEDIEKVFIQRLNLWMDNPRMKRLILDERIAEMAANLAGLDCLRVWHDQALVKPPWGAPTGWHLDNPYWSFYHADAITIWIALDDMTPHNGCLYFIPGTHKTASWDENATIEQNHFDDLFTIYPEWRGMDAVCAEMRAGSCSFHNGLVAHGAHANMTPRPRRAMACAYMPDGSTFNGQQNVLPDDYFESLSMGDPLDNDDWNPIVYRRGDKSKGAKRTTGGRRRGRVAHRSRN